MSAEFELQKAVKIELDDCQPLADAMGVDLADLDFLDYVTENQSMPYCCFGNHRSDEWDVTPTENSDGYGHQHRVILHFWSDGEGKGQVMEMISAARAALRDTPLALTGYRNATMNYQSSDIAADPDGQAYQGILIFRAITEEI